MFEKKSRGVVWRWRGGEVRRGAARCDWMERVPVLQARAENSATWHSISKKEL